MTNLSKKFTASLLSALVALVAVQGLTATAHAQSAVVPTDLGTAWPAAKNVSKSPSYYVYRWVGNGAPIIQINRPDGRVVTVGAITASGFQRFSIGEMAKGTKTPGASGGVRTLSAGVDDSNNDDGANSGKCPCKVEVVYDDDFTRILVVTDKDRNVIDVITIELKKKP